MIYYAVVYMKDGQIHLKPFDTKEGAANECTRIKNSVRWGEMVDTTKVVKKDPNSPWYQSVKGYWI